MSKKALLLHGDDNCAVALMDICKGDLVAFEGNILTALDDISIGHKMAVSNISTGSKVYKYGAAIGSATKPILRGEHIHTQNLVSDYIIGFHR
ncbi:MAG: hydrolase [Proteobacteria bacterium]|nr:hydrolase [Pseudomonadota bacterium]